MDLQTVLYDLFPREHDNLPGIINSVQRADDTERLNAIIDVLLTNTFDQAANRVQGAIPKKPIVYPKRINGLGMNFFETLANMFPQHVDKLQELIDRVHRENDDEKMNAIIDLVVAEISENSWERVPDELIYLPEQLVNNQDEIEFKQPVVPLNPGAIPKRRVIYKRDVKPATLPMNLAGSLSSNISGSSNMSSSSNMPGTSSMSSSIAGSSSSIPNSCSFSPNISGSSNISSSSNMPGTSSMSSSIAGSSSSIPSSSFSPMPETFNMPRSLSMPISSTSNYINPNRASRDMQVNFTNMLIIPSESCSSLGSFTSLREVELLNDLFQREEQDEAMTRLYASLINMLPDADPEYLQEKAKEYAESAEEEIDQFLAECIEKKKYPKIQDYDKRQKQLDKIHRYTTRFDLNTFLTEFPNPFDHFQSTLPTPFTVTDPDTHSVEIEYTLSRLYALYPRMRLTDIKKVFSKCSEHLPTVCAVLARHNANSTRLRCSNFVVPKIKTISNMPLLQWLAFLEHRAEIEEEVNARVLRLEIEKEQAIVGNAWLTCACCFDDKLLARDCFACVEGCVFCAECVRNGSEVAVGEGRLMVACFADDCKAEFSDKTLESVLDSVAYLRFTQRRQNKEIAQAHIDGLESCPFCYYATIPSPDDKHFVCLSKDCMKVSCRQCRHEEHVPQRCNEIEYEEDVKIRTAIENVMTEAMIRKCKSCGIALLKLEGCNKISCTCGTLSCYCCGNIITGYDHFNANTKCKLHTDNVGEQRREVLREANRAKVELGVDLDPTKLKFDPTRDF